jgi:hypothetical protein
MSACAPSSGELWQKLKDRQEAQRVIAGLHKRRAATSGRAIYLLSRLLNLRTSDVEIGITNGNNRYQCAVTATVRERARLSTSKQLTPLG